MRAIKIHIIVIATNICFAQTSLLATNKPSRLRMAKTALVLAAVGTVGTGVYTFPKSAAEFAVGGSAGFFVSAGAYHAGRLAGYIYDDTSSRCFIGATGALGFGVGAALHNYIPTMPAADVGYVLTCGTLAGLPLNSVANLIGVAGLR